VKIVKGAARRLRAKISAEVCELIAEHTIEGRKAVGLLADAYAIALHNAGGFPEKGFLPISPQDVKLAIETGRILPSVIAKAKDTPEVGKTFGLGVLGYLGSVIEIETVSFPARESGKGALRVNDTAGSMVKDSMFNAGSALRKTFDIDLYNWDIHVNIIGGGQIDGPSAGLAITLAVFSAITGLPLRQDVAVTGEVSLTGDVKAIGGIYEKIYGAKQAGMKTILVPSENQKGIKEIRGIEVKYIRDLKDALDCICPNWRESAIGA
jgi:ATP-dependent Lon protease